MVLEQQQVVLWIGDRPGGGMDAALQRQGVAVADAPQPPDPERPGTSTRRHAPSASSASSASSAQRDTQSVASRIRFISCRKAAA